MTCSIQDGAYNAQIGWRQMNQSAAADNYHVTSTDCDVSSQQASKMTFTNLNTLSLQTRDLNSLKGERAAAYHDFNFDALLSFRHQATTSTHVPDVRFGPPGSAGQYGGPGGGPFGLGGELGPSSMRGLVDDRCDAQSGGGLTPPATSMNLTGPCGAGGRGGEYISPPPHPSYLMDAAAPSQLTPPPSVGGHHYYHHYYPSQHHHQAAPAGFFPSISVNVSMNANVVGFAPDDVVSEGVDLANMVCRKLSPRDYAGHGYWDRPPVSALVKTYGPFSYRGSVAAAAAYALSQQQQQADCWNAATGPRLVTSSSSPTPSPGKGGDYTSAAAAAACEFGGQGHGVGGRGSNVHGTGKGSCLYSPYKSPAAASCQETNGRAISRFYMLNAARKSRGLTGGGVCGRLGGLGRLGLHHGGMAGDVDKVNLCRVCGKTYARPSTLKTHLRTHSGEKPYRCATCQKSFSQAANLTAHVRTHSGEKPFSCQVCDRRFSQSSSVTTHMRTHSGERPYRCRLCKKAFSDSSTLTKHLRIHSGEKPYQCKLCLLRFSQSGNLNRHMKVHAAN